MEWKQNEWHTLGKAKEVLFPVLMDPAPVTNYSLRRMKLQPKYGKNPSNPTKYPTPKPSQPKPTKNPSRVTLSWWTVLL